MYSLNIIHNILHIFFGHCTLPGVQDTSETRSVFADAMAAWYKAYTVFTCSNIQVMGLNPT